MQGPYGPQPAAAHLVTVDGKAQILVVESGPESSPEYGLLWLPLDHCCLTHVRLYAASLADLS